MTVTGRIFTALIILSCAYSGYSQSSITIDLPIDYELIAEGTQQDVEFTAAGYATTDLLEISVSYDGALTYNVLSTGSSISELTTANYVWDTDSPDSTGAWLKIENLTDQSGGYKDSVYVTIVPYISFPYSMYDVVVGDYIYVDWEVNTNVSSADIVEISISYDGGGTFNVLETGLPFSNYGVEGYGYSFLAEGPTSSSAIVRIENLTTAYVAETESFAIERPILSIDYVYNASDCGLTDGEMEVFGLGYGATYNIFYTVDGAEQSTTITNSEVAYLSGLGKGDYTNIYVEYNGIYSDTVAGPIFVGDESPRLFLEGFDNTYCSTQNGSIQIVDSTGYSVDFKLYSGTDTTANPLSTASGSVSHTFSGLAGGLYTIVVQDVEIGYCSAFDTITIKDVPDLPVFNVGFNTSANPTTVGGSDGYIDVASAISGGSGEYSYQWYLGIDTATILTDSTSSSMYNLSAGSYSVIVSDGGGSGCQSEVIAYTLVDPPQLSNITYTYVGSANATVQVTMDTRADVFFVVTNSATPPTADQIANGFDENGNTANSSAIHSNIPSGTFEFEVGLGTDLNLPLIAETTYNLYIVASNGNFSDVLISTFTTTPTPEITSISPLSGPVGTVVTITGTNFLDSQNKLYLGDRQVTIDSESNTELKFTVPSNGFSYADINVLSGRAYATKTTGVLPYNTTHDGGFVNATSYNVDNYSIANSWDVAMGDFNYDGYIDRARIDNSATDIYVELRNSTNDGYETAVLVSGQTGMSHLEVADMNGDGYMDLITSLSNSGTSNTVMVYYNDGGGISFSTSSELGDPDGSAVNDLIVGDLNGDGLNDVLTVVNTVNTGSVMYKRADSIGFEAPVALPTATENGRRATIVDFNNDGLNDIAVSLLNTDQVAVYLRNNTNTDFDSPTYVTLETGAAPIAISSGDFDGDGNMDIVAGASSNATTTAVYYVAGNGDGTFQTYQALDAIDSDFRSMVTGDVNGDGLLDIITGSYFSDNVRIFCGNGDGTFKDMVTLSGGPGVQTVELADINGDGADDIHVGSGNGYGYEYIYQFQTPDVNLGGGISTIGRDIVQGTTNNLIYSTEFSLTGGPVTFSGLYFNVDGSYDSTDFVSDGFQLWYNIGTDDFLSATSYGTASFSAVNDSIVAWSFTESFPEDSTIYLYISLDVAANAAPGNSFYLGLDELDPVETFGIEDPKNKVDAGLINGNIFTIVPSDSIAPIIIGDTIISVTENTTFVQNYSAGETVTWTLFGSDESSFSITADGDLSFNSAPDFENPSDSTVDNIFELILEAMDSVGNVQAHQLTITVLDSNDNVPVIADPSPVSLDENSAFGTEVVSLSYTDADTTTTTYSWTIYSGNTDVNTDGELAFAIDSLGSISVNDSSDIDYELITSFSLEVVLSDGLNTDTLAFTIDINDIAEDETAPVIAVSALNTNDSSPELSGTIDDTSASISVNVDGSTYSATNNEDGTWTLVSGTITSLAEGSYTIEAVAIDSAMNTDTATAILAIDLTTPVITLTDLLTADTSPELSGSIDDNDASITIAVDGSSYPAINNADGTWSLAQGSISTLGEGIYTIEAVAVDSVNNADTVSATLIVDLTAPTITVDLVSTSTVSPALTGSVNDTTAAIVITVSGTDYDAVNNGDSTWTLAAGEIASLTPGTYEVVASATDSVGNVGTDVSSNELTILLAAPVALDATSVDYYSFTANWNSANGASIYLLDVGSDVGFSSYLSGYENLSVSDTFQTVGDLNFSTSYFYRVRAVVGSDTTDYSNVVVATTSTDDATALDSAALLLIYDSLSGTDWIEGNWRSGAPLADWTGITMTGTRVTELELPSNNLKGEFPDISTGLEMLDTLNLGDNEITSMLDLSNFTELDYLNVANNRLQFASLEYLIPLAFDKDYGPQKTVLEKIRTYEEIGNSYTIDRTVSGNANSYTWFKDGVEISETSSSFNVSVTDFSVDGSYVAVVSSSNIFGLELTTEPVILRVTSIERDSAALRAIYDALDGPNSSLSDWTSLPIDQWGEITITNSRVTAIDLSSKGLKGELPEDIIDITGLITADLSENEIDGLPLLEGYLSNLTSLDLSDNMLTFEDLEKNASVEALSYSNQKAIGESISEILPVGSSFELGVTVGGTANSYSWTLKSPVDTLVLPGETGASLVIDSINYQSMGIYTVEVTNDLVPGLTLSSQPMQVLASATLDFTALDTGNDPFVAGEAFLLQITAPGDPFDSIASVRGAGTGFIFENVILGDYLIAVEPDDLKEFLPTYFESTDLWTEADTLLLRMNYEDTLNMAIIPPVFTEGAKVSGIVEANFGAGTSERIDARRKVKRAGCSVRRFVPKGRTEEEEEGTYELYAYVQSDDEGYFEFTGLVDGKYRFNIEYPGIPMDTTSFVEFTIGEGGIEDEELILAATVTETGIFVEQVERLGFYRKYFKDLTIYPNPADQYVTISYSKLVSASVMVRLIDLSGNVMSEQLIDKGTDSEIEFDVSSITGGIYLLNFVDTSDDSQMIATYKVIVNH